MVEYLGKEYVAVEPDFLASPSFEVAPRLIGCVLHHDNRGEDVAIALSEVEAYDESDRASHDAPSQLLPHGHVYIHPYARSGMWAMDLVCGAEGQGSSVLIRAAIPVLGIDIMAARRSADPTADRDIRTRAMGFEKKICNGPCSVGEALGIYPLLDGASLFRPPFRIYRPVDPIDDLINGVRINITKDADRPWRWKWRNPPVPSTTQAA